MSDNNQEKKQESAKSAAKFFDLNEVSKQIKVQYDSFKKKAQPLFELLKKKTTDFVSNLTKPKEAPAPAPKEEKQKGADGPSKQHKENEIVPSATALIKDDNKKKEVKGVSGKDSEKKDEKLDSDELDAALRDHGDDDDCNYHDDPGQEGSHTKDNRIRKICVPKMKDEEEESSNAPTDEDALVKEEDLNKAGGLKATPDKPQKKDEFAISRTPKMQDTEEVDKESPVDPQRKEEIAIIPAKKLKDDEEEKEEPKEKKNSKTAVKSATK
ncbi:hypothetical protein MHLP_00305 [Candidatus Mycoplasma haematolamae str. Purdue]|uniref:Uncharacterized protein n=1 Tax=Mycoplasma haematolamae (strain Purdue) TaxID=1212765 RepID=I7CEH7_MYCHA|nr:hypothetical protein [Candidatus Mycoplasma haematolamae]AFO51641.1 hypothetical protein MHLP_00305 [Candidatus Mycoplasma haematolamae str. Purdue]